VQRKFEKTNCPFLLDYVFDRNKRGFQVIFDSNLGQEVAVGDLVSMRGAGDFGVLSENCK
jgi:hypothetical protein